MIYQIAVPGLVADVEEIRVLEWHGGIGHEFGTGDMIVELETHKALVEVRAGQRGVLRQILVEDGGWQKIGAPLCLMSDTLTEALPESAASAGELLVEFEIT
jgi:pyruvate/2-oxoglutarate dehydrogenase complex dihydrolipoamide acyltransferase (E2) component